MNNLHPATELMFFVLCIVFVVIGAETRLFDNLYFEYGFPIFIAITTLALRRYWYNKTMEEMKRQKEKEEAERSIF